MNAPDPSVRPPGMPEPAADHPVVSEPENLSDSDWLDISGTDREFDDNDSIFSSSRETDHEHPSRSRSRRSSLSCDSSREGDIDVWEGMIEDSADEALPDQVRVPPPASLFPHEESHPVIHSNDEMSLEEQRVNEALDQSMVSTLSSSRSSSLHASTLHHSVRDLRLSFPDPITSSREELKESSYEDIRSYSEATQPSDIIPVPQRAEEEETPASAEVAPIQDSVLSTGAPPASEFNISLYGFPTPSRWSIVTSLLEKVAEGAGVTITASREDDSVRQFSVTGHSGKAFPHIITVTDKIDHDCPADGPSLTYSKPLPSLAIVYMPSCPPHLPESTFYLPVVAAPHYDELLIPCSFSRELWNTSNIPERRALRLTPGASVIVDERDIDDLDPIAAYRAFHHMWSNNKKVFGRASVNDLRCLAMMSIFSAIMTLVFGIMAPSGFMTVSRMTSMIPIPAVTPGSCTSASLLQLLLPTSERPKDTVPPAIESPTTTPIQDLALSVFCAELASASIPCTHTPSIRRTSPCTLQGCLLQSKDLILRPTASILVPDNQQKSVSVAPSATTVQRHSPASTVTGLSSLTLGSSPNIINEYTPIISAAIANDIQVILDALDALVQAISKQVHTLVSETALLLQRSVSAMEKNAKKLEDVKGALYASNARARKRAKQLTERGAKWLFEATEAVAHHVQPSKRKEKVLEEVKGFVEEMTDRAERARRNAKKMAGDLQQAMLENEKMASRAWATGEEHWNHLHKRSSKACKKGRRVCGVD
ncbi:hypothetical protein EDD16DRAFT_1863874 [Pisolithus croceorrhizus]|nr:hypothetical protein EDD16DRAFT_1863874 [Pisolithus croceorrhizus]